MHHRYIFHGFMHHGNMHHGYMPHGHICLGHMPQCVKGAKDEVKEARRATSLKLGSKGPRLLVIYNFYLSLLNLKSPNWGLLNLFDEAVGEKYHWREGSAQLPNLNSIQLFLFRQNLPIDNASLTLIHVFFFSFICLWNSLRKNIPLLVCKRSQSQTKSTD